MTVMWIKYIFMSSLTYTEFPTENHFYNIDLWQFVSIIIFLDFSNFPEISQIFQSLNLYTSVQNKCMY